MSFVLEASPRTGAASANTVAELADPVARRLRRLNLTAGVFHLASALLFLAIATDFDLPVTASFPTEDPALTESSVAPLRNAGKRRAAASRRS